MAIVNFCRAIDLEGGQPEDISFNLGGAHRLGVSVENLGPAPLSAFRIKGRVSEKAPWQAIATVSGDYSSSPLVTWREGSPTDLAPGASAAIALEVGWFAEVLTEIEATALTTVKVCFFAS